MIRLIQQQRIFEFEKKAILNWGTTFKRNYSITQLPRSKTVIL